MMSEYWWNKYTCLPTNYLVYPPFITKRYPCNNTLVQWPKEYFLRFFVMTQNFPLRDIYKVNWATVKSDHYFFAKRRLSRSSASTASPEMSCFHCFDKPKLPRRGYRSWKINNAISQTSVTVKKIKTNHDIKERIDAPCHPKNETRIRSR